MISDAEFTNSSGPVLESMLVNHSQPVSLRIEMLSFRNTTLQRSHYHRNSNYNPATDVEKASRGDRIKGLQRSLQLDTSGILFVNLPLHKCSTRHLQAQDPGDLDLSGLSPARLILLDEPEIHLKVGVTPVVSYPTEATNHCYSVFGTTSSSGELVLFDW
jgi:hypothetical protein